jgi:penicillin V acylase-like amidase (Ntn superfamily)
MRVLSLALTALVAASTTLPTPTSACSRIVAATPNATAVSIGRSMDWPQAQDTRPDVIASPVGISRSGDAGPTSLNWTAAHGSVCTGFMGIQPACVDGVNTAGLSAGLLFLPQADMALPNTLESPGMPPALNVTSWAQHALDTYASVDEAVAALSASPPPYVVSTFFLPDGTPGVGHLMLTDSTGKSVVIEPVDGGRPRVFTSGPGGGPVRVMTNGPTYGAMLAKEDAAAAAGTVPAASDESVDRFQRATYWLNRVAVPADPPSATAVARTLIRTVATPLGAEPRPGSPEASTTQWTSATDLKRGLYILEPAGTLEPTVIPLESLALDDAATPVRLLKTGTRQDKLGGVMAPADFEVVEGPLPGVVAKDSNTA